MEGGSRGKAYVYYHDRFVVLYGRNQHIIVIIFQLKNKVKKEKENYNKVSSQTSQNGHHQKTHKK